MLLGVRCRGLARCKWLMATIQKFNKFDSCSKKFKWRNRTIAEVLIFIWFHEIGEMSLIEI